MNGLVRCRYPGSTPVFTSTVIVDLVVDAATDLATAGQSGVTAVPWARARSGLRSDRKSERCRCVVAGKFELYKDRGGQSGSG
jgi:hypothetical protein